MAERQRPAPEAPNFEQELADACTELLGAIDKQARRIVSYSRQSLAQRLDIETGKLTKRQLKAAGIPGLDEAHERLRHSRLVPIGTQVTGEGHSIGYFWSVYPLDTNFGRGVLCLAVDEVAKDSGSQQAAATRLYDILVEGDRTWVVHDGQTVESQGLSEPLQIVRESRDLYI